MIRIIIGAVLILIGLGTLSDSEAPFFWVGGIFVGVILIIQGIKKINAEKRMKEWNDFLQKNEEKIFDRITSGETIDSIANDLFTNKKIPVSITYQLCGEFILKSLKELDSTKQEEFLKLIKNQRVDSKMPIGEDIKYFSDDSTVIKYDDSAEIVVKNKKEKGLLILSKANVIFFPENKGVYIKIAEGLWDKLYDIPIIGFIPAFFDLVFIIKSEAQSPLSSSKLSKLQKQYNKGDYSAIAISEIEKFDTTKVKRWFLTNTCILIKSKNGSELCLGTSELSDENWIDELKQQITLIALAEGNHIV